MADTTNQSPNEPTRESSAPQQPSSDSADRAVDRFAIFEQVALERLQAGADSTKAASFLPLPVRMTAIAAASIAAVGVLWSIVARVPVQVNGTAAIVPPSGMGSLSAGANGKVFFQVSGLAPDRLSPNQRQRNAQLGRFWIKDATALTSTVNSTSALNQLVRTALAPVSGQDLVLPQSLKGQEAFDDNNGSLTVSYPPGTVVARVENATNHQELNSILLSTLPTNRLQSQQQQERLQRAGQLGALGQMQNSQRQVIAAEIKQRRELYQRYLKLWKQGFLPATALLQEQSTINNLEAQLLNTDTSKIQTGINRSDQIDQSQQVAINNLDSRNKLETALITFLTRSAVFAPDSGFYILASNFNNGSSVREGDELVSYTIHPPALPQELPVFLDAVAAQQVSDGMSVLLTPKGISRAQYGGIPGTVVQVTKLPLQADGLLGVVGSRGLVATIQQQLPAPYLVRVRLEQAEPKFCRQALSRRCYRWSSGRLPPHPVRLATLADVQITTTYRRPIDFVMPALRRALGLVVDNQ
ncbi:MAG: hypothetical protein VKM98_04335 [Cyanobacteriota bacterium]|nr:hypothetical protein [Cyanobacteriota bacterium]